MREHPVDSWNLLRKSGSGDGRLEVPSRTTGIETGFGPARFALGSSGEPRLLVPCSGSLAGRNLGTTPKLDVSVVRYEVEGTPAPFIDITSQDRNLDAVFSELVAEILIRLEGGRTPEEATAGTIADFRDLLFADSGGVAPKHIIVGLLGELHVLSRLAAINPAAVDSWTGPVSARQDFRRKLTAIEVKTSSRSDATYVHISGVEQLLSPKDGKLLLVHVRIEQSEGGDMRVEAAFEQLVGLGVDRTRLLAGLTELGCTDPRDPAWNRFSFELQNASAYRVSDGFPRVVPEYFPGGELPPGISKLEYSVDLALAGEFRLKNSELVKYLTEFMA